MEHVVNVDACSESYALLYESATSVIVFYVTQMSKETREKTTISDVPKLRI